MPLYESVFIARQDVSASQVDALADQFAGFIQAGGGEVKKRENWGLRNLAYRIKKNRKGHYVLFNIEAPPAAITEMERNMSINEDVIRYLTVRVDELETEPSAIMRSRGSRDDRGGRRPGGRFHGGDDRPRGGRSFRDGDRGDRGGDRGGERRGGDGETRQASDGDGA